MVVVMYGWPLSMLTTTKHTIQSTFFSIIISRFLLPISSITNDYEDDLHQSIIFTSSSSSSEKTVQKKRKCRLRLDRNSGHNHNNNNNNNDHHHNNNRNNANNAILSYQEQFIIYSEIQCLLFS